MMIEIQPLKAMLFHSTLIEKLAQYIVEREQLGFSSRSLPQAWRENIRLEAMLCPA